MKVMAGKKKPGQSHFPDPEPKPEPPVTTPVPVTTAAPPTTSKPLQPQGGQPVPPQHQTQNPADKIQLSELIIF